MLACDQRIPLISAEHLFSFMNCWLLKFLFVYDYSELAKLVSFPTCHLTIYYKKSVLVLNRSVGGSQTFLLGP